MGALKGPWPVLKKKIVEDRHYKFAHFKHRILPI